MRYTLREARMLRDKSITDMAKELNVTRDTYRNWENNPGQIKIANAERIALFLDMPIDKISFFTS